MFHHSAKMCDAGGVINAIIASHAQVMILCVIPLRAKFTSGIRTLKLHKCEITFAGTNSASMIDLSTHCPF